MRLSDVKVGGKVKVVNVGVKNILIKRHLLEMGLTKDTTIKVVRKSPMGDPICIELRGYELAIRLADAEQIIVGAIR